MADPNSRLIPSAKLLRRFGFIDSLGRCSVLIGVMQDQYGNLPVSVRLVQHVSDAHTL